MRSRDVESSVLCGVVGMALIGVDLEKASIESSAEASSTTPGACR